MTSSSLVRNSRASSLTSRRGSVRYKSVAVEFQRNGEPLPSVAPTIKTQIVKTLQATKIFEPVDAATAETDKLFFVMNNVADMENARAQGFKTGFTFGGAGSLVSDNYIFSGKAVSANGKTFAAEYKHALHTAIGNTDTPPVLTATTAEAGVNEIIDDLVLNFLLEYQVRNPFFLDSESGFDWTVNPESTGHPIRF